MKQVMITPQGVVVEEVPRPLLEPKTVVVRVEQSCISTGTELATVKTTAGVPLWKRAISDPALLRRGVEMITARGMARTRALLEARRSTGSPLGYSAAGTVLEVGHGIDDLRVGDRVACAGAQCAHHAEIIRVPRNLAVRVPDSLGFEGASTVALGAIAMQGVRRAAPELGETFVVLGLGAIGQIAAQLLRVNGCRTLGVDPDAARAALACALGLDAAIGVDSPAVTGEVLRRTGGIGADGVIIAASSASHEIVSTAFQLCRRKGRVVVVGDVGLNLRRGDFYSKEIDFLISTSYGPGRYDPSYEEGGIDYPVGYVRWSENRNMGEYLRLLAEGKVDVGPLIADSYPVERAQEAYAALSRTEGERPMLVRLTYPVAESDQRTVVPNLKAPSIGPRSIRLAVVGVGGFARSTHLPNLQDMSRQIAVRAVVSRTPHNATAAAKQLGAAYAATDFHRVIEDGDVDAVLITTRHDLHAELALGALQAGKHVLVEKPLALTREELNRIGAFYASLGEKAAAPVLLTGFNRRFSPFARRVRELVAERGAPMVLDYRMNAGAIPADHWVHHAEGGGRNRGEACHVYDLFTYLVGAPVVDVVARAIRPVRSQARQDENFVATLCFAEGSIATLTYTSLGSSELPKERLEVFVDGKALVLDDYRELTVFGSREPGLKTQVVEKGHREELEAFVKAVQDGGEWPIPLWQQVQATEIALRVEEAIGGSV